jgi:hypothetical protein
MVLHCARVVFCEISQLALKRKFACEPDGVPHCGTGGNKVAVSARSNNGHLVSTAVFSPPPDACRLHVDRLVLCNHRDLIDFDVDRLLL